MKLQKKTLHTSGMARRRCTNDTGAVYWNVLRTDETSQRRIRKQDVSRAVADDVKWNRQDNIN
jgi:hypothetical protein